MRKFLSSLYWGETKPTQRVEVFDALWTDLVQTSERLGMSHIELNHIMSPRWVQIFSRGRCAENLMPSPSNPDSFHHFHKTLFLVSFYTLNFGVRISIAAAKPKNLETVSGFKTRLFSPTKKTYRKPQVFRCSEFSATFSTSEN